MFHDEKKIMKMLKNKNQMEKIIKNKILIFISSSAIVLILAIYLHI